LWFRTVGVLVLPLFASTLAAQGKPRFINPPALPPSRGYTQLVDVPPGSRLVLLSGQVPLDSAGQLVGGSDFRAQATQVFENLKAGLAAGGASFRDVVKISIYLRDVAANLTTFRQVRDQYVNTAAPPASTLVQVDALFRPDVLLEVEVMAVVPK
jgi:enamine deaminase RidA (YjgF/YER057c/UK114 family)